MTDNSPVCDRCEKSVGWQMHARIPDGHGGQSVRHLECFTEEETYKDNGGWRNRPQLGPKEPPPRPCDCGDCEECDERDDDDDEEDES